MKKLEFNFRILEASLPPKAASDLTHSSWDNTSIAVLTYLIYDAELKEYKQTYRCVVIATPMENFMGVVHGAINDKLKEH